MKKLLLLAGLILLGSQAFAFEVVYPKKNDVIINAKSTFFIGSSAAPLKINGQNVPLHPTGAFAYVVPLNSGDNTFILQSGEQREIFVITKQALKTANVTPSVFSPYSSKKILSVTTEDAPLRSTPVDAGINRIAHLQRDIKLQADGEKDGFYRVILGKDKSGWISKTNVKLTGSDNLDLAQMSGYEYIDGEDYFTFVFHLTRRVPFEMIEGDPFIMKFYNIKDMENNIYTFDFPIKDALSGRKLIGYSGEYQENDFILKIRKPIITNSFRPLHNIRIAIDAGHGGDEAGGIGCLGDKEKDINLSIAKYIQTELKKRGAHVIMTRSGDNYVSLKDRVEIANYGDAVVFISIHGNALPDGADPNKNRGTSIYYYYPQSKPLADIIMDTVTSEIGVPDDKVRQGSLAVVRNTNALSILIEVSYLINPEDNANLINPEFQKQYAKAIADSLERYFEK